jgi:excisionase family DNA binding protein
MANLPPRRSPDDRWLLSHQVAAIFEVSPKTVNRWGREGKLPHVRTLGGHRRYSERAVRELYASMMEPATDGPAAEGGSP